MIRILKIFVLILFPSVVLFSQPEIIFEKTYDNNKTADFGFEIIRSSDEGFIIVGSTGPSGLKVFSDSQGLIIKIDNSGNIEKIKICGKQNSGLLTSVTRCDDGYIAAGSRVVPGYGRQAWLLKFDENLNIIWEKMYGGKKDDNAKQIMSVGNKLFFVIGDTKSYLNEKKGNESDVWLMKIDIDGNMRWNKTFNPGSNDMGTSIDKLGDDRFILCFVSCTAKCGSLLQEGFTGYFVIDIDGNIIFSKKFAEGKKNKLMKVKATSDGGAIAVGATSMMEKFPSEDIWIVKVDNKGNIVWSRIFNTKERYDGAFNVVQTDKNLFVVGYSQIEKNEQMDFDNFIILGLDNQGNVLWKKEWGGKDNDDLYSVIVIDSDTIVSAGFKNAVSWPLTKVPGNSDVYVIKLKVTH